MAGASRFLYGICIIITFIFTLVALFTPAWRSYKGHGAPTFGLVTRNCGDGNRRVFEWDCQKWAANKYPFEKATLALLVIALFCEVSAIGIFFALFSPRLRVHAPAITLSVLTFICLFSAVIVYAVRNEKKTAYMLSQSNELLADAVLGYSYWIAVAATVFAFFATLAGGGILSKSPHAME